MRTLHSNRRPHFAFLAWTLAFFMAPPAWAQEPKILEVKTDAHRFLGLPIQWGKEEAILLDRSGAFHFLPIPEIQSHQVLDTVYRPQSLVEARTQLQLELGERFEVAIAGPYVIATPKGMGRHWQSRFSALLAGYARYFKVRRWELRKVDFPLVVIVFPNRAEFSAYARTQQPSQLPQQAVGSYFPMTNRCILYQIPGQRSIDWGETESTIIHEAVHQLAYNTGLHERLFKNPFWFVEGLATMFENRTVYDLGLDRSNLIDRVNRQQLMTFRPLAEDAATLERLLRDLITSDNLFKADPRLAYASSWAMTFYLAERMPSQYQSIVRLQNRRGHGSYSANDRLSDFSRSTGMSVSILAAQMSRFYKSLDGK